VKAVSSTIPANSAPSHISDAILVRRALGGDADAFAALFQAHKGRVYAVCLRMTNNAADADDLTQEAFIQAFRKLATFRGESALSTWLHRVAVNTALMHFRRRPATRACIEQGDSEASHREFGRHDERLKHSLDRIALARALEALPSGYRTIFELHEIGGYGHREIAKLLHCSVGNSKSQLHKAKQRIRECLGSRRHFARQLQRTIRVEASRKAEMPSKTGLADRSPVVPLDTLDTNAGILLGSPIHSFAETAV